MKFKISVFLLLLVTLVSCSENTVKDRFFPLPFYEEEIIPSTTYLSHGESAAVEFYAAESFSGVEIIAAKVNEDDTLTVSVYEFNTDYETTLKENNCLEKATFKGYNSLDSLIMSFKSLPKGKYLLTFTTKNSAGICVATYPSEQAKNNVTFYLNGAEYENGAYYASLVFDGDRLNKDYYKEEVPSLPTPEPGTEQTEDPAEPLPEVQESAQTEDGENTTPSEEPSEEAPETNGQA